MKICYYPGCTLKTQAKELDIKGITTVAGNQTIEKTTRNTLDVVEYLMIAVL